MFMFMSDKVNTSKLKQNKMGLAENYIKIYNSKLSYGNVKN